MKNKKTIIILGGGYTGATAAVDISRNSPEALDIIVVEPQDQVGRGVAYSARHPDHRLNAPTGIHNVIPEEPGALNNWFNENIGLEKDPQAEAIDGSLFIRRWDFGSYVNHEFERHRKANPSASTLRHVQATATDVERTAQGYRVTLSNGPPLDADNIIITTSNDKPTIPFPFSDGFEGHPGLLSDPWDVDAITAIPKDARVFIIGTGLTAADVIAALASQDHEGLITSMSRRGLRPTSRPIEHAGMPQPLWERVHHDPPLFTVKHGRLHTALGVFRAIRSDVAKVQAKGLPWQMAFDDLRDSLREVWIDLPPAEKRRVMRHAGAYYDIHRFRYPPPTENQLKAAEAAGILERRRGHLMAAKDRHPKIEVQWHDRDKDSLQTEVYDYVVCCVGPQTRPEKTNNPLLHALLDRGLARPSPLEVGLDTDLECRAIAKDGGQTKNMFVFGPLTFATFGYSLGVPFILPQIRRALPALFSDLGLDDHT